MTPESPESQKPKAQRRHWLAILLLVQLCGLLAIGASIELRRATQSEVNSGSRVNAYVGPYELSQWTGAGGGPTNGQTAAQVGALIKKTNDAFAGVIGTNGTSGTFQFSTTGTNTILAVATNAPGFGGGGSGISQAQFTAGLATGTNDATFNTVSTTNTGGRVSTMATGAIDNTHGALIEAHTAATNGAAANSEIAANYFVGAYLGNLAEATNLLHGNTVSGTASQITMTLSKNSDGSTNFQAALANPLVISQANIGTLWGTNVLSPTNAFGGTVVDFNVGDSQTNLAGNLTFTGVANVTAGAVNTCIIRLLSGGSDRTIAFPASWHLSRGSTSVVTNAYESDFLFTVVPGQRTNVAQLDYP